MLKPHLEKCEKRLGKILSHGNEYIIKISGFLCRTETQVFFLSLGHRDKRLTQNHPGDHFWPHVWPWTKLLPQHWTHQWENSCILVSQCHRAKGWLPGQCKCDLTSKTREQAWVAECLFKHPIHRLININAYNIFY